jgi:uncharacterized membrane protein
MKQKTLLTILFVVSFLAIVDGAIITYEHYSEASTTLCDFGPRFNCNVASQSVYSTIDNIFYFLAVDLGFSIPIITLAIPVAVVAMVTFLLIKIGALHIWHDKDIGRFNSKHILWSIRYVLGFSLIYGAWLIYVQAFILKSYCLYCLILDLLILLSLIVSFMIKPTLRKTEISFRN